MQREKGKERKREMEGGAELEMEVMEEVEGLSLLAQSLSPVL